MNKSDKDHFQKLKIRTEAEAGLPQSRVMKVDTGGVPVVQQFSFGRLERAGEGNYEATKAKYGAISATDSERMHRGQRDRRFSLNPLVKEPLSIEEEERRVIDQKVEERVAAITAEARAKGVQEGYQAGLAKGHREAFELFQNQADERMAQFEGLLAAFEGAKAEIFRANERFLMELVFRVARTVALKEVAEDREYVVRLCRELLERIGARDNIRIRLHPDDAGTALLLKPALEQTFGALGNLTVEPSELVRRGGCIVETEWNEIDASLDTQFEGIHAALLGREPELGARAGKAKEPPAAPAGEALGGETS